MFPVDCFKDGKDGHGFKLKKLAQILCLQKSPKNYYG